MGDPSSWPHSGCCAPSSRYQGHSLPLLICFFFMHRCRAEIILSIESKAPFSSEASRSLTCFPIIKANSTSKCKSTPFGLITGPAPGGRMEDAGFKKKKGCLGLWLFSSVMWSLGMAVSLVLYHSPIKGHRERVHTHNSAQCRQLLKPFSARPLKRFHDGRSRT